MTATPDEITPRQIVAALIKVMRPVITVRQGGHNQLIVEGIPPPMDTRFVLRFTAGPTATGNPFTGEPSA